ncbi:MAG: hypothetical protein WDZ29_05800 [Balneolaceae bacterium]
MAWRQKSYRHKLAVMGDSMGQGFKNGGIYRTDLSFPAMLSRCFAPPAPFNIPSFSAQGGIPLNLEVMVRGLSDRFGNRISLRQTIPAVWHLYKTLRRIKQHWETRTGPIIGTPDIPWHNQAIWGFAANDTWLISDKICRAYLNENKNRYSIFNVLPNHAMYITGRMVLNPSLSPEQENHTQLDNIKQLHQDGGIENLIVCVGHNNFIGALTALDISYSNPKHMDSPHFKRNYTVYRPEHFEKEMKHLFEKVATMSIPRVYVPTYPYATIPPVTRGINEGRAPHKGGYFDYYTRFWIWDEDFDPDKNPHLTREKAIELDQLVDRYNEIVRSLAAEYGFIVVPAHKYINAVARRRLGVDAARPYPPRFVDALKRNPMTSHLVNPNGGVRLSTDYIRVDQETRKITTGGIFSLDGLHPTTVGYGLVANIYYMTMKDAGTQFEQPLDWDWILNEDTLISDPPYLLTELRLLLRFLSMGRQERFTRVGQGMLQQLLDLFTRR